VLLLATENELKHGRKLLEPQGKKSIWVPKLQVELEYTRNVQDESTEANELAWPARLNGVQADVKVAAVPEQVDPV
jgi:hypothetical protein